MKRAWLDRVHSTFMLRECMLELAIHAKKKTKAKKAAKVTREKADLAIKRRFLKVIIEEATDASRLKGVEDTILSSYRKITLRKVLFALQTYTLRSQREKVVSEKYKLGAFDKFFGRWQNQAFKS